MNRNDIRHHKNFKLRVLIILIIIILLLYFFWAKTKRSKQILIGTGIVAATAFGLEVFDYDLDLQTLWKTGSIQESRVQDMKGVRLIGSCVVADAKDDLNCDNFATQAQAQAVYQNCVEKIEAFNRGVDRDEILKLDVYGLDGDKDGIVCEHLPMD